MEKKSLFIIGGVITGVLVLLILIVWIVTTLNPAKYSYEELEEKMVKTTEKYYHKNPGNLPTNDGTYSLDYSTLVSAELIKPLNEILDGGESCSAHIIIIKSNNDYSYIPYLNCGEKYKTKELYRQVLDNSPVVTTGSGLYYNENEYYFKGKVNNNYVSFGTNIVRDKKVDILWKIVSIKDGLVKLKAEKALPEKPNFDDRYNESRERYDGYNDFDNSILSDYLINLRNGNPVDGEEGRPLLNEKEITKVIPTKMCIGTRLETDGAEAVECNKLSEKEYHFTIMTPYEYMRASLDENCNSLTSESCSNFNYLSKIGYSDEWSAIPFNDNDYQVYVLKGTHYELEKASTVNGVYPMITLNKYSFFKSGTGTLEDPYRIK